MQSFNRYLPKISIGLAGAALVALAVIVLTPSSAPTEPTVNPIRSTKVQDVNPTVFNKNQDLWGSNMGDFISLWWEQDEQANAYRLFRSHSNTAPWEEIAIIPLSKGVDFTSEAMDRDLCYRVEALDINGVVIRNYDLVCIPKFMEK